MIIARPHPPTLKLPLTLLVLQGQVPAALHPPPVATAPLRMKRPGVRVLMEVPLHAPAPSRKRSLEGMAEEEWEKTVQASASTQGRQLLSEIGAGRGALKDALKVGAGGSRGGGGSDEKEGKSTETSAAKGKTKAKSNRNAKAKAMPAAAAARGIKPAAMPHQPQEAPSVLSVVDFVSDAEADELRLQHAPALAADLSRFGSDTSSDSDEGHKGRGGGGGRKAASHTCDIPQADGAGDTESEGDGEVEGSSLEGAVGGSSAGSSEAESSSTGRESSEEGSDDEPSDSSTGDEGSSSEGEGEGVGVRAMGDDADAMEVEGLEEEGRGSGLEGMERPESSGVGPQHGQESAEQRAEREELEWLATALPAGALIWRRDQGPKWEAEVRAHREEWLNEIKSLHRQARRQHTGGGMKKHRQQLRK